MTTPLDPLRALAGSGALPPVPPPTTGPAEGQASFADVFKDYVKQVDQAQTAAEHAITAVQRGESDNLHRVMLAQSQAQLSLKMAVEVRNKLVEAYKDVMRTQF